MIALLGTAAVGLSSLRGATITVTEVGDGFGVHTNLRQALVDAHDGDTIEFAPQLGGYTLGLMPALGELVVDKSVTISWVPPAGYPPYLGVSPWNVSRVFYISPGKTVTISGLTIFNGSAPSGNYFGGGIYNDHATLTVSNCTITGNSAFQGVGGGIFNDNGTLTVIGSTLSGNSSWFGGAISNNWLGGGTATVTITNSTLSGNSASYGGAIINENGTLTMSNSTVSGNSAEYGGGAISNGGLSSFATVVINNSTFSGNSASHAGGILNAMGGTLTVTNSTLSGNSAGGHDNFYYNGFGGGILNEQMLTVTNSTLSGNSAVNSGGGIYNAGINGNAPTILKIGGTIFNAGSSGGNIYNEDNYYPATVTSLGYNLSSDDGGGYLTATGDRINSDPRLGPLQSNGGPTFTHLPASNSPAIDRGDPTLAMDQRGPGFARVVNSRADIGAVEVQAAPSPTPTPTPTPRPHGRH